MTDQTYKTFVKEGDRYRYVPYTPKHVIAGDTDSAYIDLSSLFDKDANIDDVVAVGDDIGNKVNESFDDLLSNVFNVPPERHGIVKTSREIVSSASYFAGKKMYMMRVVDEEGRRVDKLKIMGLAIKKSDTPAIIQDFLQELVLMMMDGESFESVQKRIDKFKDYYHTCSLQEIGRPTNIKNLNKYSAIYDRTGEMKGFPYHAAASIYYNSLCGPSDIKIRSGDKIKVVYIEGADHNAIAIPADAEELPKFLDDIRIDWKRQWETVRAKIDGFLEPIGYDWKSRQNDLISSFVEF